MTNIISAQNHPLTVELLPELKKVTPFLKWVGGKRKIADKLIELMPRDLNRDISNGDDSDNNPNNRNNPTNNYYEPFLGGGALFYKIKQRQMFKNYYLSDINLDLVNTYNAVKTNPNAVSIKLKEHEDNNSKEYYYNIRASNNSSDPYQISARLLYLNKYSFKGIYRINKSGSLNMSYSTRTYQNSKMDQTIQNCSNIIKDKDDAMIYASDYSFITPKKADFVYFDPPYHNAGEQFYTRIPFDENEQVRLASFAKSLNEKGVRFMLSNSDTHFVRGLYKDFNISTIEVSYAMSRGGVKKMEVVVRNY